MKIVVFGLSVTSSWGNGHATLWRALAKALRRAGHSLTFFEKDVPYYAQHRDSPASWGCNVVLYPDWEQVWREATRALAGADAAIVTSYCPVAKQATDVVLETCRGVRAFYDLDTPVTLQCLRDDGNVPYLPVGGLHEFDVVFSFAGGRALTELETKLGARRVFPLYASVDPEIHHPVAPDPGLASHCSYLGTYAEDRQNALEWLFLEPARRRPGRRFMIAGALYGASFPWWSNVHYVHHLPPDLHARFFCSSRITVSATRRAMVHMGHCPSGRLFEAAACAVPVLSDEFPGLEAFFTPGEEILVAHDTDEALAALERSDAELATIGRKARERVLREHTGDRRAAELVAMLERGAVPCSA